VVVASYLGRIVIVLSSSRVSSVAISLAKPLATG